MIQIEKRDSPPEILETDGVDERRAHSVSYAHDPEAYQSGERSFEFDDSIYGHESVKSALIEAQHRKCSFCESKVTHVAYGDVEHFRPKSGHRQHSEEALRRPGYYWLAYEWTNLFLCCPLCNRRHKNNLFPLRNPEDRAQSHRDEIEDEEPVFLHPGREDPEAHIGFRKAVAFAKDGSTRGRRTIEALRLNREALMEVRRDYLATAFKEIRVLLRMVESGNLTSEKETEARQVLRRLMEQKRQDAQRDDRPFASMLCDALEKVEAQIPEE
ncbi:hypothetical protein [Salinibacter altiplanensis]|uniref:hypothetical protein n=1 Tax=Salinibacter altiplanensis TaxID=1803181 RepID=UPI000C9FA1F4|nr:hypothetical protein [Salinibacter altiplanensis]